MKMIELKQLIHECIQEILGTPVSFDIKRQGADHYFTTFMVDNIHFVVTFYKSNITSDIVDRRKNESIARLMYELDIENTYEVRFFVDEKTVPGDDITKYMPRAQWALYFPTGKSKYKVFEVLNNVIMSIKQFISQKHPDVIVFGGATTKQERMYQQLINRFISKFDYVKLDNKTILTLDEYTRENYNFQISDVFEENNWKFIFVSSHVYQRILRLKTYGND